MTWPRMDRVDPELLKTCDCDANELPHLHGDFRLRDGTRADIYVLPQPKVGATPTTAEGEK